jgi:hypothetical protein
VVDDLGVVAVGVEDESPVIAGVVVALAGRAVVAVAGGRELAVERVDGGVVRRLKCKVQVLRR